MTFLFTTTGTGILLVANLFFGTVRVFKREFVKKFPREIQQRAFMRLNAIDAAVRLEDL